MEDHEGTGLARVAAELAHDPTVQEFAGRLVGSAGHETGELLADHVRFRRFKAELRILSKAKAHLEEAGIDPCQVNLRVLAPLIEYSSLERDQELSDKWAALLANAATDEDRVPPSFPDVLRQLTPGEARLLDALYGRAMGVAAVGADPYGETMNLGVSDPHTLARNLGVHDPSVGIENLIRLRLLRHPFKGGPVASEDHMQVNVTTFGRAFVEACRPPSPRDAEGDSVTA